jgi:hypothetical protein
MEDMRVAATSIALQYNCAVNPFRLKLGCCVRG